MQIPFLLAISVLINGWTNETYFQDFSYSNIVVFLTESARKTVLFEKWDEYDEDGVAWFVGNFVDVATQSRLDLKGKYDMLFIDVFNQYFIKEDQCYSLSVLSKCKNLYEFIDSYNGL